MLLSVLPEPVEELVRGHAQEQGGRGIVTPMVQIVQMSPEVQQTWAATPITERLRVLRRAKHIFVSQTEALCAAVPPELARNCADTLVAEVLPLLAACKFLEDEAAKILAPRRLGRRGRPLWLSGVSSEVQRVALGRVMVIAPSNYPLFLPGVQVLQALAAGNAVVWKPGHGGQPIALLFADVMTKAGLPQGLLLVTDESIEAAQEVIAEGVDKVFFTGSAASGRVLLRQLAEALTPCVAELSGCDAVFVLPSADISRVVKALAFGMRLNGSATCMAPRRIILVGANEERRRTFIGSLLTALDWVKGVRLPAKVQEELHGLIAEAVEAGATLHGKLESEQQPILLAGVTPSMRIAGADIFAPVLSLMEARDLTTAIAMHEQCPYALTASIFGDERETCSLAERLTAGTVVINDLIVPTADPRLPFGGRRNSGFGVTRGKEGLLEMTAVKVITARRGESTRHFDATTETHQQLFEGVIRAQHSKTWKQRIAGLKQMISAAKNVNGKH
jgi:aldehyde dehydrogenase (NAD+)